MPRNRKRIMSGSRFQIWLRVAHQWPLGRQRHRLLWQNPSPPLQPQCDEGRRCTVLNLRGHTWEVGVRPRWLHAKDYLVTSAPRLARTRRARHS